MSEHIVDGQGARIPITGHWCDECGLPLHPSQIAYRTHPTCDTGEEETT